MPDNFGIRINKLRDELESLKRQRKEEERIAKIENTWVRADKRLPTEDMPRVLGWAKDQMEFCWHIDGKWYAYNGTWALTEKERLNDVTYWMPKDWLYAKNWPLYGPGLKNRLRYYWQRFTQGASDMARDMRPKGWGKNAQLDTKVVYYKNEKTGEIRMGAPERFAPAAGFTKVVCNTANEAERWSDRLRQYNAGKESKRDEERSKIESEMASAHRSQIHHLIANSRSKYGRDFLRKHLERMDKAEARMHMTREEYLHSEGFERGH